VHAVCCDVLEMNGIAGAHFVHGDFTGPE
jgi:hypothetical protein